MSSSAIYFLPRLSESSNAKSAGCATCSVKSFCLPAGLSAEEVLRFEDVSKTRRRIAKGEFLYEFDAPFVNLYAIRFGNFKTYRVNSQGALQITDFQMSGELLGLDAIHPGVHHCAAIALEDSEICEIPFSRLDEMFDTSPKLLRNFQKILSREITRAQRHMLLMRHMDAEQRLAAFLLDLSSRYAARGYSPIQFVLRMSREDISRYLGLSVESISRLLQRLKCLGVVKVNHRELTILDLDRLTKMATDDDCSHAAGAIR
jgi:CRP/FNR family transcriptional regulator